MRMEHRRINASCPILGNFLLLWQFVHHRDDGILEVAIKVSSQASINIHCRPFFSDPP